jgi:hypothetical protein
VPFSGDDLGTNAYAIGADACIGMISLRLDLVGRSNRRVAYFFESGDQGHGTCQ